MRSAVAVFTFPNAKPLLLERGAAAKLRRAVFLFAFVFFAKRREIEEHRDYQPQIFTRAVGDGLARPATDCEAPFLYWSAERQRSSEGSFSSLPLSFLRSAVK